MAEGSMPQRERTAMLLGADGASASPAEPRVFALVGRAVEETTSEPPRSPSVARGVVAASFASALALAAALIASGRGITLALAVALPVAACGAALAWWLRERPGAPPASDDRGVVAASAPLNTVAPRALSFDGRSLVLTWQRDADLPPSSRKVGRGPRPAEKKVEERRLLAEVGDRFGVTLLCNRKRDRVAAAITSPTGCFLVAARLSPRKASSEKALSQKALSQKALSQKGLSQKALSQKALSQKGLSQKASSLRASSQEVADDRRADAAFLRRATVISSEEVALDAIGPDGEPIELDFRDFRALIETLEAIDPSCTDRVLLSDPSGAPLQLDGEDLEVRGRHFDLSRPLEWRSILFQEQFGQALTLYQGTWIRQGAEEVVLVSLLPPSVLDPSPLDYVSAGQPELDLAAMRDQRLMQASAGEPPPHEQRVAVDGLFMLPLRVALDQAPRNSQQPAETRHA